MPRAPGVLSTCSRCGQKGHTVRTCPGLPAGPAKFVPIIEAADPADPAALCRRAADDLERAAAALPVRANLGDLAPLTASEQAALLLRTLARSARGVAGRVG